MQVEVVGPHLRLQAYMTDNTIRGYLNGEVVNETGSARKESEFGCNLGHGMRAIETGDRTLVRSPFADAIETLALIDAAVQSRDTGRFINVEELN